MFAYRLAMNNLINGHCGLFCYIIVLAFINQCHRVPFSQRRGYRSHVATKPKWDLLVCASLCIQYRSNSHFEKRSYQITDLIPTLNSVPGLRPLGSTVKEWMWQTIVALARPGDGPITTSLSMVTKQSAHKNVCVLDNKGHLFFVSSSVSFSIHLFSSLLLPISHSSRLCLSPCSSSCLNKRAIKYHSSRHG